MHFYSSAATLQTNGPSHHQRCARHTPENVSCSLTLLLPVPPLSILIRIEVGLHQFTTIVPITIRFSNSSLEKHTIYSMSYAVLELISPTPIALHDCASIPSTSKLSTLPLRTCDHLVYSKWRSRSNIDQSQCREHRYDTTYS